LQKHSAIYKGELKSQEAKDIIDVLHESVKRGQPQFCLRDTNIARTRLSVASNILWKAESIESSQGSAEHIALTLSYNRMLLRALECELRSISQSDNFHIIRTEEKIAVAKITIIMLKLRKQCTQKRCWFW